MDLSAKVQVFHQALIFGDYMKQIKELSKIMGFKVLEG